MGQATADAAVNDRTLTIVNGAMSGKTADAWDQPSDVDYNRIRDTRLPPLGLTEAQVVAAWVGYASSDLNPEPYAYESGLAAK